MGNEGTVGRERWESVENKFEIKKTETLSIQII